MDCLTWCRKIKFRKHNQTDEEIVHTTTLEENMTPTFNLERVVLGQQSQQEDNAKKNKVLGTAIARNIGTSQGSIISKILSDINANEWSEVISPKRNLNACKDENKSKLIVHF